jgi:hypothetical protein
MYKLHIVKYIFIKIIKTTYELDSIIIESYFIDDEKSRYKKMRWLTQEVSDICPSKK